MRRRRRHRADPRAAVVARKRIGGHEPTAKSTAADVPAVDKTPIGQRQARNDAHAERQVAGRCGCPTDMPSGIPPYDPGGRVHITGHPNPSVTDIVGPAPVMKCRPAPVPVRVPGPHIILNCPVPVGVRTPAARQPPGRPDTTPLTHHDPIPVGRQRCHDFGLRRRGIRPGGGHPEERFAGCHRDRQGSGDEVRCAQHADFLS